jgi:hypothetical protein
MLLGWLDVVGLAACCKAGWLSVVRLAGCSRLAGCCSADCLLLGCLAVFRLAGSLIRSAVPARDWLPNLCLAGNPVTRIPDFVQPWWGGGMINWK